MRSRVLARRSLPNSPHTTIPPYALALQHGWDDFQLRTLDVSHLFSTLTSILCGLQNAAEDGWYGSKYPGPVLHRRHVRAMQNRYQNVTTVPHQRTNELATRCRPFREARCAWTPKTALPTTAMRSIKEPKILWSCQILAAPESDWVDYTAVGDAQKLPWDSVRQLAEKSQN